MVWVPLMVLLNSKIMTKYEFDLLLVDILSFIILINNFCKANGINIMQAPLRSLICVFDMYLYLLQLNLNKSFKMLKFSLQ